MNPPHSSSTPENLDFAKRLFDQWFSAQDLNLPHDHDQRPVNDACSESIEPMRKEWHDFLPSAEDVISSHQWRVCALSEIVKIGEGCSLTVAPSQHTQGAVPYLTLSDMPEHDWIITSSRWLSEAVAQKNRVKVWPAGTTLLSKESHLLRCGLAKVPVAFNRSLLGCIACQGYPPLFVHLLLKACHETIMSHTTGCRPRINQRFFDDFHLNIPPLVAAVAFDRKVSSLLNFSKI
jgi:hypothetical protein